jgi:hypothetical protein
MSMTTCHTAPPRYSPVNSHSASTYATTMKKHKLQKPNISFPWKAQAFIFSYYTPSSSSSSSSSSTSTDNKVVSLGHTLGVGFNITLQLVFM